jgi:hypothetical protein
VVAGSHILIGIPQTVPAHQANGLDGYNKLLAMAISPSRWTPLIGHLALTTGTAARFQMDTRHGSHEVHVGGCGYSAGDRAPAVWPNVAVAAEVRLALSWPRTTSAHPRRWRRFPLAGFPREPQPLVFFFVFPFFLLVHCGAYKSSYNISNIS